MKYALAAFLWLHGFCHLVGFVVPWKIAKLPEEPYKTTLFMGRVDVGDAGIRVVGILWLLVALAYGVCGAGVVMAKPWWIQATVFVSLFSLALSVAGLPGSKFGIPVNVALVTLLLLGKKGWW
ncbi:MAG: hypothetical protein WC889_09460 [Myxococcota bacterium]|jgi:hypothetical protein